MIFHIRAAKGCDIRDGRLKKATIAAESEQEERKLHAAVTRLSADGSKAVEEERKLPDVSKEVGNVLDHWERLPNDLRSDPGFTALDKALNKLYRAVME